MLLLQVLSQLVLLFQLLFAQWFTSESIILTKGDMAQEALYGRRPWGRAGPF